jgi:leucyl-tRNA synthetase
MARRSISSYQPQKIESKWQKRWERTKLFQVKEIPTKQNRKKYILDMFPYTSADGLHVGHAEGYVATDIISRYLRMNGFYVLHPMGWDAFGLPAENYAIKKGIPPWVTTEKAIKNFRRQIKSLGLSYDWSREIATIRPEYYKWTQWFFLLLYKNGLAYRTKAPANWCPSCQTVLANEQVIEGKCERCKNEVIQKELEQWFFKTTHYAEELLKDLEKIDWPEKIKEMQRNWIGRSEGAIVKFPVLDFQFVVNVFTTRLDTLFGVTYLVLAPEHPLVEVLTTPENKKIVEQYLAETKKKNELERIGLSQEKTGVPLGSFVLHPFTGEKIPLWIADYVLLSYGTGAVMGVPAHDERDFAFAKKYHLPIKPVIVPQKEGDWVGTNVSLPPKFFQQAYLEPGLLTNSQQFSGLDSATAKEKILKALEEKKLGKKAVFYHMRDWLISRQRYWGAPIPIIYCSECAKRNEKANNQFQITEIEGKKYALIPVPENQLPVRLPRDVDFRPTGESPLARSKKFHQGVKCPYCGSPARREVDTMDTFMCSSWYYLRYCDPKNKKQFADSKKIEYWCPVDLYIGGAEHAVMHLLYVRFFTKVLADLGYLSFREPILKYRAQGIILAEDGRKMSKSFGNVINPDEIIKKYGADTLRLYEMFMGDFEEAKPWNTKSIIGVRRFLERVWQLQKKVGLNKDKPSEEKEKREKLVHKTIKKVTEDIEAFKFNTAIAALMSLVNEMSKWATIPPEIYHTFLKLLHPFAPHLTEELFSLVIKRLDSKSKRIKFLEQEPWPKWQPELVKEEEIDLVVQVNGKLRDLIRIPVDSSEEQVKEAAFQSEKVKKWLSGREIKRVIFVKNKLINFVIE